MKRVLVGVLIFMILVSVPALFRPLLGHFSTKQVVYAMIAENFVRDGQILSPKINYLMNGKRALHLLEWPFPAYCVGSVWGVFGGSLDFWGRIMSLAFFLGGLLFLYQVAYQLYGCSRKALLVCVVFMLFPIALVYAVPFQVEGAMFFFFMGGMYLFFLWKQQERVSTLVLWTVTSAGLFLLKPQAVIFYLAPLGVLFLFRERRWRRRGIFILACGCACIPFALWLLYVKQTAGISDHVFYSLVDSVGVRTFPPALLREATFYRDLGLRLARIVFTPLGVVFLTVGFFTVSSKEIKPFLFLWWGFSVIYMFLLPRKMVEQTYYLLPVACPGAFFVSEAIGHRRIKSFFAGKRVVSGVAIGVCLLVSFRYSAGPLYKRALRDSGVVAAGEYVNAVAPEQARVVAAHGSGLDLLYYCRRPGWNFFMKTTDFDRVYTKEEKAYFQKTKDTRNVLSGNPVSELTQRLAQGGSYLAVVPKEDLYKEGALHNLITDRFSLLKEEEQFVVYRLTQGEGQ